MPRVTILKVGLAAHEYFFLAVLLGVAMLERQATTVRVTASKVKARLCTEAENSRIGYV